MISSITLYLSSVTYPSSISHVKRSLEYSTNNKAFQFVSTLINDSTASLRDRAYATKFLFPLTYSMSKSYAWILLIHFYCLSCNYFCSKKNLRLL